MFYFGPTYQLQLIPQFQKLPRFFFGVASVLFYLPLVRELMLFMGAREITRPTITGIMTGSDANMAIVPGGMQEQVITITTATTTTSLTLSHGRHTHSWPRAVRKRNTSSRKTWASCA